VVRRRARRLATGAGLGAALLLPLLGAMAAAAAADPATLDQAVGDRMARWHLPGAQAALAQDGQLVLSRAYGLADGELIPEEHVQPQLATVSVAA
jgi:CubicO group peptidase (beta-lactamase class C family)